MKNISISILRQFILRYLTCFFLALLATENQSRAQSLSSLAQKAIDNEKVNIEKVLTKQTDAWNQVNLEQFMETYWKSDRLTFSGGGTTVRGWQATLDRYRKKYATAEAMGKLHFDQLEVTILESKTGLVLGNWHLTFADGKQRGGNFSLVMHKLDDRWLIVHDHTSEKREAEAKEQK